MKGKITLSLIAVAVLLVAGLVFFPSDDDSITGDGSGSGEQGSGNLAADAPGGLLMPPDLDPRTATPQDLQRSVNQMQGTDSGMFPTTPDEAREFITLDAEGKKALTALMDEFRVSNEDRQFEILDEIETSYYANEVLGLVEWILDSSGEDLKLRAIELLAGNTSPNIIALMERGLSDKSESIRQEAAVAVSHIRGPEVVEFLGKAFEDSSQNVRLGALDAVEYQTSANKLKIYGKALASSHTDVATASLGEMEVEASYAEVDVIIGGLDSSNQEVVEETRYALEFMFDVEFKNSAEARTWWQGNRDRYDADLVEKD